MLSLKVKLNFGQKIHTLEIGAHKSRAVSEILKKIAEWFKREVCPKDQNADEISPGTYTKYFQIVHRSICLGPEQRLEEVGITEDCDLDVICLLH